MNKKNQLIAILMLIGIVSLSGCKKEEDNTPAPAPGPTNGPKTFLNITFNSEKAYFSTDGSMSAPVDSNQAKTITGKIDFTFIYNFDYSEPGFFDPVSRSQEWYWDDYYNSWLSTSIETRFYSTDFTKSDFDAAQKDQSKIATYFSDPSMVLAPHAIFPTGSCIGGRESSDPTSIILSRGQVFGFINTNSGKRGLLYIRTDQPSGWPFAIFNSNTKVDILRET